ncbi:RNA polymerase sigma factor [bacterium]|nr:RNA polymerase sigma factor [candidate division CSSED10-310 bacterium]
MSRAIAETLDTHIEMTTNNDTDIRNCILDTRMGNRQAFGLIVERYRTQSVRIAVSIVGDIETAKDLSQDAFIKAYRALHTFDLNAPFMPWFYRILTNVCRDYIRKRTRFRNMIQKFKGISRSSDDLNCEIHRDEIAIKVRQAVEKLDPKDREIIELKHFAGFDYNEIAKILNIPKGTVMSRLFYARKALRQHLERSLDFISGGAE